MLSFRYVLTGVLSDGRNGWSKWMVKRSPSKLEKLVKIYLKTKNRE